MIPVECMADALHFLAQDCAGNVRHHVPGAAMHF
jgi:hypothetical protein